MNSDGQGDMQNQIDLQTDRTISCGRDGAAVVVRVLENIVPGEW
jgi:hypothetical protein